MLKYKSNFKQISYNLITKTQKPTTDPKEVMNGGGLLPIGGSEESGSYILV